MHDAEAARAEELRVTTWWRCWIGYRTAWGSRWTSRSTRRAARAHSRVGAVVCDTWHRLPVHTGSAALVLDVFAPRNGAEIARVLHRDGALVLVAPTDRHLAELVEVLGLLTVDSRKRERLDAALGPHLKLVRSEVCEFTMTLDHAAVTALVQMGPSARHADPAELHERITNLSGLTTATASVQVSVWRRLSTAEPAQETSDSA